MKRGVINEFVQLLYPDDIKCIVCGKEIHPNRYGICDACKLDINLNYCLRCGRHKVGMGDYCGECSSESLYFDEARSAVSYDGQAKDLIRRLKYGGAQYLAKAMSEYLLDVLIVQDWDFDCFTFVPVHKTRLKKRGYNQAEILARELAERTDKPCAELLQKERSTPNQARLNKSERMENLKGAFSAISKTPKHVVLIDDVMTTGATASECAKTLKRAGASVVYLLTFASVPEKPLRDSPTQSIRDFRR